MDCNEKIQDLSSSSKNFGSNKNIQRGSAAEGRRPTLYVFFSDTKLFRQLLKSRNCSFQSILACRGESENYILGTLDLLSNYIVFNDSNVK